MLIIPAIDLQGGEAVRLFKGDYAAKTVYSNDPVSLAQGFEQMGANYLHVVDLDGAKDGSTENLETIRRIRASISIPMQVGGGIRTAETVSLYLDTIGINRVILGTVAVKNPDFVREMLERYSPEQIVVGVDVRDGKVATAGWLEDSGVDYLRFIEQLRDMGVRTIVATDISRDGTLTAPNWEMYRQIADIEGIQVIVSGGLANTDQIEQVKTEGHYGVIVGKAYYEGKVDLAACLKNESSPA
ncbi:MAG: 1-(5-phosphoribosyl)-5-[(5-phosphoribosylamino)methylideneamino]imidazole-4-carboxamide isomerase [Oscillospiraceae bacterium]|nr:1-(5-phosphoribosyl)-5-[(5-phosphoribosylamino)methylideneamino]imidazole-4-carboxamide isomerase [Oscillospiraceae bacterium]